MRAPRAVADVIACAIAYAVLSIPEPSWEPPDLADRAPFAWDQQAVWEGLEARFNAAKERGCEAEATAIDAGLSAVTDALDAVEGAPGKMGPDDPTLATLETALFELAAPMAACPSRLDALFAVAQRARRAVKDQARAWDPSDAASRDRLYRLLYGTRMAVEEVILQLPAGAAPTLLMGTPEPSAAPSAVVRGLTIHSGDLLVSRGGAPTSAFIARGNTHPGNFSHVALAHVAKDGTVSMVEAHIESGVGVFPVERYLEDKKLRILVLRLRADLPAVQADPLLAHKAAEAALADARGGHIPYDFTMDMSDASERFCSEVATSGYAAVGVELFKGRRPLATRGATRWLADVGVRHFDLAQPSDLEYDPDLRVVAEWRGAETLMADHVDNAILDALLERAERGERLEPDLRKLAPARVMKAWSMVLNAFGRLGPIPEGMSATTALKIDALRARHADMRDGVVTAVAAFRAEHGYTPPYWRLVQMARDS